MSLPAFPTVKRHKGKLVRVEGMTLRDYCACEALPMVHFFQTAAGSWNYDYAAEMAYEMADAMLRARSAS